MKHQILLVLVDVVGDCVSYVEKSFDASVVKPFNGACVFGGPGLAEKQRGRHDARMEDAQFDLERDLVVL